MSPARQVDIDSQNKLRECLQVMDQMQRKIARHEQGQRDHARQQDQYNELLIKYNTMVYKANTNETTLDRNEGEQVYANLRQKSPSRSVSKERDSSINHLRV